MSRLPSRERVIEQMRIAAEFAQGEIGRDHARDCLMRLSGMSYVEADEALDLIEESAL